MLKLAVVWLGQLLSFTGSAMTRFVLAIWLWEQTGEATALILVGVFAALGAIVTNLTAGVFVDRFNRKFILVCADLMVGFSTLTLLILASMGQLAAWHIYIAAFVSGLFGTLHFLTFMASMTLVVPKQFYTRANSLVTLAEYASVVAAPTLAGILIVPIGIQGVMLIDIATLLFAIATVAMITIPSVSDDDDKSSQTNWQAVSFGFRYIFTNASLRGLMLVLFAFTLSESFGYPLIQPMILARTGGDQVTLGIVLSTLGVGGVLGGLIMTVWGGFKRKVNGVLIGLFLTGLLGDALMGMGQVLPAWLLAGIFLEIFIPLAISSNNTIWQLKVPPQIQGRVFAARNTVTFIGEPIALILTGFLADNIFEPAMATDGWLAPTFGGLVGTGPGAGMGLLLVICGLLSAATALWGYVVPAIRNAEMLLPDVDLVNEPSKSNAETA